MHSLTANPWWPHPQPALTHVPAVHIRHPLLSPCGVADREPKAVCILLHQLADQRALADTRGPADHNGGADARQVNLRKSERKSESESDTESVMWVSYVCGAV